MHDNFTSPDFYQIDDLLSEEHKLIRESTRQWVSKSVSPIIEDYAQKAEFPKHLIKELGEIGAFGPYIPEKYGGAGLDQISYHTAWIRSMIRLCKSKTPHHFPSC